MTMIQLIYQYEAQALRNLSIKKEPEESQNHKENNDFIES